MNWLAITAGVVLLIVYPLRLFISIIVGLIAMVGGGFFSGIGIGFVTWMIITVISFILPAYAIGEFIARQTKMTPYGQDDDRVRDPSQEDQEDRRR